MSMLGVECLQKCAHFCCLVTVFFRLQRFTADFRDLTSWVTEMKALINADELANDVAGAEALLDRHQEHKVKFPVTQFSRLKIIIIYFYFDDHLSAAVLLLF